MELATFSSFCSFSPSSLTIVSSLTFCLASAFPLSSSSIKVVSVSFSRDSNCALLWDSWPEVMC